MEQKLNIIGIDNLSKDIFVGLAVGVLLIVMNILGLFSLALPPVLNVFQTNIGKLAVIVLVAPIIEEIFFRSVLSTYLYRKLPLFLVAILQGFFFASFHLIAYSGVPLESFELSSVLIVGGAFLSAWLFGFAMTFLSRKTNNLLTTIIPHAMINFWLVKGLLVIV